MNIIVATQLERKRKPFYKWKGLWVAAALTLSFLVFIQLYFSVYWFVGAVVLIFILLLIGSFLDQKTKYFKAYVSGPVLNIDFQDTVEQANLYNGFNTPVRRMQMMISSIVGYRLHSFLGASPELMDIEFKMNNDIFNTRAIPIYYLDKEQQEIFIQFLDGIIAKTKRINS